MLCESCLCGCLVLPYSCLYETDSRLKAFEIERHTELLNIVNTVILIGTDETNGILGADCYFEMCAAIKAAYSEAQAYKKANVTATGAQTEFWYYLPAHWKALLQSPFFKMMYAAFVVFYYYDTYTAASETVLDGDVQHNRGGGGVNGGDSSKNITADEASKKAMKQKGIAQSFLQSFKVHFWAKNQSMFAHCGCQNTCTTNTCGTNNLNTTPTQVECKDGIVREAPYIIRPTVR